MNWTSFLFVLLLYIKSVISYRLNSVSRSTQLTPHKKGKPECSIQALNGQKENFYYCGEDRVALVTGAGRGIGRSIAKTLAKSVSHVLCISRTQKSCDNVVSELKSMGYKSTGYAADVSNREEITELINKLLMDHKNIDILVNNAGITQDNIFMRMKGEEWENVIKTNLNSLFYVTQPISKKMIANKYGRIINISSIVGLTGNFGQANYAAAKAGVIGFTKALSKELASRNITVNAVAPGFISSDMTDKLSKSIKDELLTKIPAGRMGTTEEVANVVGYLASEIAGYINGRVFVIDGGMAP